MWGTKYPMLNHPIPNIYTTVNTLKLAWTSLQPHYSSVHFIWARMSVRYFLILQWTHSILEHKTLYSPRL